MDANDLQIVAMPGPTYTFLRDDRDTSSESSTVEPGEAVKVGGAGRNFAILILTGDPTIGLASGVELIGIVSKESTEVAAVDGEVECQTLIGNASVIKGKATTVGSINTAAELLAIRNDHITFDVTTTVQTIDETEGDDPNVHGLFVLGGDIALGTLDVIVNPLVCIGGGGLIGQTMD